MSLFKCKMCGGDLNVQDGVSVVECDYCGTKQTVSATDDEKRINLYNRANHLRMNSEFDKAAGLYEQIVAEFPNDAEAYWGLCLCNYGVEYVDDPATGNKIPTIHRASFEKMRKDENYERALENADMAARLVYQDQAKEIDRIMGEVLAISQDEKPYDIFICYKETDEVGGRTVDSVIAQNIYDALTDKGYKVFFSRITLEDKLGKQYEPYIFAALNSAKVMLAVGTDYEYYNAVWVKNEWRRFWKLAAADKSKVLIPCYKDMDAYDMPNEFKGLQAQDMSKVGAMQDLLRGIDKIFDRDKKPATAPAAAAVASAAPTVAPLLERAFMFLEDKKWEDANAYCEKVLDVDPKNAQAYLGKLLAEVHVCKLDNLKNCAQPFDYSENYQKVLRFGDEKLKAELRGYITYINERNENARLDGHYKDAFSSMQMANTEGAFKAAAAKFHQISTHKNAAEMAGQCLQKAEVCRKDEAYASAKASMTEEKIAAYETAIKTFQTIPGWKDSNEQIYACQKRIAEIKAKEGAARLEAEKRRIAAKKKAKKIALIATPIVVACIAFVIVLTTVIIPNSKYNVALDLMGEGKYSEAITAFKTMDGYKDSANKIADCQTALKDIDYNAAISLMKDKKYNEAITAFKTMDGYKDSANKIADCQTALKDIDYNAAISLMKDKKYDEAITAFEALNGYKDSGNQIESCYMGKYGEEKWNKVKKIKIGDTYTFGSYEQDNNKSNGKEAIEWTVLDKDGMSLFLISKRALDCQRYDSSDADVTWEKCSLRKWMNGTFLNNAFSADEKAKIATTNVSADKNPEYSTNPGNATSDKVFLLSITEAEKYFTTDKARKCAPTAYAKAQGAWRSDSHRTASGEATCWWWLRSPGSYQDYAAIVSIGGSVDYSGDYDSNDNDAVRPALWIDLSK